jgi:hypothetical protein
LHRNRFRTGVRSLTRMRCCTKLLYPPFDPFELSY